MVYEVVAVTTYKVQLISDRWAAPLAENISTKTDAEAICSSANKAAFLAEERTEAEITGLKNKLEAINSVTL